MTLTLAVIGLTELVVGASVTIAVIFTLGRRYFRNGLAKFILYTMFLFKDLVERVLRNFCYGIYMFDSD